MIAPSTPSLLQHGPWAAFPPPQGLSAFSRGNAICGDRFANAKTLPWKTLRKPSASPCHPTAHLKSFNAHRRCPSTPGSGGGPVCEGPRGYVKLFRVRKKPGKWLRERVVQMTPHLAPARLSSILCRNFQAQRTTTSCPQPQDSAPHSGEVTPILR